MVELPSQEMIARVRRNVSALWPLMADKRASLAALVGFGVAAAIVEGIGFSLVIVLIYRLMGGSAWSIASTSRGALLGPIFALIGQKPIWIAAAIAVLVLAKGVLTNTFGLLAERIGTIVTDRARVTIFNCYLEQDYQDLIQHDQAVLINRISYDSDMIAKIIIYLANILINILSIAVYGLLIARISSVLAAVVVLLGFGLMGGIAFWVQQMSVIGAEVSAVHTQLFSRMLNGVQALRTIKLYGAEKAFEKDFRNISGRIAATSFKLARLTRASHPIRDVGLLVVLGTFLYVAHSMNTTLGTMTIIVAMLYRILPHITGIEEDIIAIFSLTEPLEKAVEMIKAPSSKRSAREIFPLDPNFRKIEFKDVFYKYPLSQYMSLSEVSFEIRRGTLIAIEGRSGSGKSTLVNLLTRLLEPTTGTILVDGVPLSQIDRDAWTKCLAFAGQDVELVDGSIADNIRLGRPDISDAEIKAALEAVLILDYVDRLPHGIETGITDRGFRMSGGQRQRIGLARAIICKPEILILDEATNAIDLDTESQIFANIEKLFPNATRIVITHRENLKNADVTVTLDWGYVVRLDDPAHPDMSFDERETATAYSSEAL